MWGYSYWVLKSPIKKAVLAQYLLIICLKYLIIGYGWVFIPEVGFFVLSFVRKKINNYTNRVDRS